MKDQVVYVKSADTLSWEGLFTPSLITKKILQLQLDGLSVDTEKKVNKGIEFDDVPMACISCSI
jgi:hypothetical protein